MKRCALLLALCGCASAQKHPALTAAIVGGVVGGLACEIDNPAKQIDCAYVTAAAAAFLGGLTGLITTFTDTSAHEFAPDPEDEDQAIHTSTPPPPGLADAGVGADAPALDATTADAAPSDQ